jgi:hypothetical protein
MPRLFVLTLLCLIAAVQSAAAMTYSLAMFDDGRCRDQCRQAIVAQGEILVDEPERLVTFLSGLDLPGGVPANVLISSPGGNVRGALALGLGLRRLGARLIVARVGASSQGGVGVGPGQCASACVFVLMGGRSRVVPDGSRVVVHQPRRMGVEQRDIVGSGGIDSRIAGGSVTQLLQSSATSMGVDPALISLADSVPNESARELTRAELRRFRLATGQGR